MSSQGTAQLTIGAAPADDGAAVVVRCTGAWTVHGIAELERRFGVVRLARRRGEVVIDGAALAALDTSGAWLLHRTARDLEHGGCTVRFERPADRIRIAAASYSHRAKLASEAHRLRKDQGWLATVGRSRFGGLARHAGLFRFRGRASLVLLHSIAHPRRFRWRVILHTASGRIDALPITGLLSFLMGIVIAYQGADQLQRFGANIFVADLVGTRDAARAVAADDRHHRRRSVGSAYTAQIGTMKVTRRSTRCAPIGVVPRSCCLPKMLALVIVLPLLTVYTPTSRACSAACHGQAQARLHVQGLSRSLEEAISLSSYGPVSARRPCSR